MCSNSRKKISYCGRGLSSLAPPSTQIQIGEEGERDLGIVVLIKGNLSMRVGLQLVE